MSLEDLLLACPPHIPTGCSSQVPKGCCGNSLKAGMLAPPAARLPPSSHLSGESSDLFLVWARPWSGGYMS